MVKLSGNSEDFLLDDDVDEISHEKHNQLLQTITSKTKRKYVIFFFKNV